MKEYIIGFSDACEVNATMPEIGKRIFSRPAPADGRMASDITGAPKRQSLAEHDAAIRKEAYEQGKKDALLEKDNLQVSTVVGYEAGYKQGCKDEREKGAESLEYVRLELAYIEGRVHQTVVENNAMRPELTTTLRKFRELNGYIVETLESLRREEVRE